MDIQRQICHFSERRDHRRPNGDVRDKVTVHYINVQHGSATFSYGLNSRCQMGKIR